MCTPHGVCTGTTRTSHASTQWLDAHPGKTGTSVPSENAAYSAT
jgi:hypothetical protein